MDIVLRYWHNSLGKEPQDIGLTAYLESQFDYQEDQRGSKTNRATIILQHQDLEVIPIKIDEKHFQSLEILYFESVKVQIHRMSQTKYVFVTGGVTSSLGKGIIAASLAKLLQAQDYRVTIQKIRSIPQCRSRNPQSL